MRIVSCLVPFAALVAAPAFAADVTVDLTGLKAGKGDLYVALQSKDQFLKDAGSHGALVRAPKSGAQQVVLKDVPTGDWSVSVWHDTDGDGKFSRAANGMPLDGWSMKGAAELKGPPSWEGSKIVVPAEGLKVALAMVYPQ